MLELYTTVGEKSKPMGLEKLDETKQKEKVEERKLKSHEAFNKIQEASPEMAALANKKKEQTTAASEAASPSAASDTPNHQSSKKRSGTPSNTTGTKKRKKSGLNPSEYLGMRVAKWFNSDDAPELDIFFGTVDEVKTDPSDNKTWWHVTYDDDDSEDIDLKELKELLKLYEENKKNDPEAKI
jgi:hypothetical protein